MRTVKLLATAFSIILVATLFAGCSASNSASPITPTAVPAPREPKHLEAKIVIEMGDLFFVAEDGTKGGTFRVPAGKTVGIHIVNNGAIEHEIMFGQKVDYSGGTPDGYEVSLLENVPVDAFVYSSGKKVEVATGGAIEEIELDPGAEVWLRITFPENMKGTWEIGCFVLGHHEAGMNATLVVY